MAEFVDNSLQSFLANQDEIRETDGPNARCRVVIVPESHRISIRDNAAGIKSADYERAFRPAALPTDRTGLSEFGMGMKSAACWFAPKWSVRTTALGEAVERTISFDIEQIVQDNLEELSFTESAVPAESHYTELILENLHRPMVGGRTKGKIKQHLESIYRMYIREQVLELHFDREPLEWEEPLVLFAPYFKTPNETPIYWKKDLNLDFGLGWRAKGFAALREVGSVSGAGFALFRRKRLIQGSADEAYRPEYIFGKSNSYTTQRLFGELELDGFEVSHTKDGFNWEDHEQLVLEELKKELDALPVPLLKQAEGHRARKPIAVIQPYAEAAAERTVEALERGGAPVIAEERQDHFDPLPTASSLPPTQLAVKRTRELNIEGERWLVAVELSNDPAESDWVGVYDASSDDLGTVAAGEDRVIGIRMNLAHPFTERFGGAQDEDIEGMLRIAVALVIAEVTAVDAGIPSAKVIRRRVNRLLRDVLAKA